MEIKILNNWKAKKGLTAIPFLERGKNQIFNLKNWKFVNLNLKKWKIDKANLKNWNLKDWKAVFKEPFCQWMNFFCYPMFYDRFLLIQDCFQFFKIVPIWKIGNQNLEKLESQKVERIRYLIWKIEYLWTSTWKIGKLKGQSWKIWTWKIGKQFSKNLFVNERTFFVTQCFMIDSY